MEKRLLIILVWILGIATCLALGACVVMTQPRFGKLPKGDVLERLSQSPNYNDGSFQNPIPTPLFTEDASTFSIIVKSVFSKPERLKPERLLPTVKTDLAGLRLDQDIVIWLGHSSWYIQLDAKRILIDPILSDYAAPFSFFNKAFEGTTIYTPEDIPEIDYLLISHDHWDHLDYPAVKALQPKVKQVVCPLGLKASFLHWGYADGNIFEGDWNNSLTNGDFAVHLLPARHYSGRLFGKNKTLWTAFALIGKKHRIFFSGDSGYGPHFSDIGHNFKGFDLVMLDAGQYDPRWALIHMTPDEAAQAAEDLDAKYLLPAHVGRFTIAMHAWDDPFKQLKTASENKSYGLVMPVIGESVAIDSPTTKFTDWWKREDEKGGKG